jgi:predicted MFS family arabinose efflux permease
MRHLNESTGPNDHLDIVGLLLSGVGLFLLVWGVVRSNTLGWGETEVLGTIAVGAILVVAFCWWESRTREPMLPLRFFQNRAFAATNLVSVAMYFGMFGSIFLLTQYLQTVLGNSPLDAGIRLLAWTGVTMFVAPVAGAMSDRVGGGPLMAAGLGCQAIALAWIAIVAEPDTGFGSLVLPFILAGVGMGLFFAPVANVVLSAVRPEEEGQASGANNALREIGGVFGVAVLAAIFAHYGEFFPPEAFMDGFIPALWVGAGVLAFGTLVALTIPKGGRERDAVADEVPAFGGLGSCVPVTIHHHEPGTAVATPAAPEPT